MARSSAAPTIAGPTKCCWLEKGAACATGISGTFPYDSLFIGECHRNRITEGKYRSHGRGQQLRRMWISDWRLPTLRMEMEAALGPLAMFDVAADILADRFCAGLTLAR
jgi:hypothetical protein